MKIITTVLLLAGLLSTCFSQKRDKRLSKMDQELTEVLNSWDMAGFAVAIVEKDQVVYAKGFGYRDYENKLPATENSLFAIGSCTKAFTSAVLGTLREEDKIDFSERPQTYVPELEFYNDRLNTQVNIVDLMSHRTGLPRHDLSWYLFPTESADTLLARLEHQEPFADVRETWYYNNFMFFLQGEIAHRITGKSWKENIKERFFDPLGMKTANLDIAGMEASDEPAIGYTTTIDGEIEKQDYYKIRAMAPAGSINSSVSEMGNWLITWINGGKFKGKQIIPANYIREAMSSRMVVNGALPEEEHPDVFLNNYGYGWGLSSYRGHYRVSHGGAIDGFTAQTAFFPSDSVGVVVLANQGGSAIPTIVRNMVADRMLKLEKYDWNGEVLKQREERIKAVKEGQKNRDRGNVDGTRPSHILLDYTGIYEHPGYGKMDVYLQNDSLFLKTTELTFYLKHYHYDVFGDYLVEDGKVDTTDTEQTKFNFRTNVAGDISGLEVLLEPTLDPLFFKRTPTSIEVDEELLESYVGEYELGPQTAKAYTKEGKLFVFLPNQPEYELVPTAKHAFNIKILEGFKVKFIEDESGNITSISFIQPNGTFTGTKK